MASLMIQTLISAVIQVILFSLIPFIWWLVTAKKEKSFFEWTGLKKPETKSPKQLIIWCVGVAAAFLTLSVFIMAPLSNIETAASGFAGMGAAALPAILIYAAVQTGLSEEIVFRGFLLKRFASRFGFTAGNIIQSILFGFLHGVMFFPVTGAPKAILIILFTGGIGWCMGFINETKAGGSIIPSWCIHAAANIFSGICSAFMLFS